MSSVHFARKPNRKRVCGSLNRTSQNHYGSEPNRTGTGQNHALKLSATRMQHGSELAYWCSTDVYNNGFQRPLRRCILCTHRKQFHIIYHSRLLAIMSPVANGAIGFLSAYDLFALYMYFKKVIQTDTIKYKASQKSLFLNKQLGGRCHFEFFRTPV